MRSNAILTAAVGALVVSLTSTTLFAQTADQAPKAKAKATTSAVEDHTLVHADLAARVNPLGVAAAVGVTHTHSLDKRAEDDILHSEVAVDGTLTASPAHVQASASAILTPINILPIRFQADYMALFGTFGGGASFDSAKSKFGPDELDARSDDAKPSHVFRAMVEPTLRLKLGFVVLRSQTRFAYYHLSAPGPFVYEPENDTLLAKDDLLIDNQSSVLFEAWKGPAHQTLLLGPTYQLTYAARAQVTRQRVGATVFIQPFEKLGAMARPRALVSGGVNVVDRNRAGSPFVTVAIGGDFDL